MSWTDKALNMIKEMSHGDLLTPQECYRFFENHGKNGKIKYMVNLMMYEGLVKYILMGKTLYVFRNNNNLNGEN